MGASHVLSRKAKPDERRWMMMLPCSVIRDLLPQYIEKLTEEETTALIREHLETCEGCRKQKAEMEAELPLEKAPKSRLSFLKKLRRRNIIGAVLSVMVAVLCISSLYNMEFIDATNTASVESAISNRCRNLEINLIESKRVNNSLLVLFEQLNDESDIVCGVARFRKGIFGGYCLREVSHSDWQLYSWVHEKISFKDYLVIYGINEPLDAKSFKIYTDDFPQAIHGEPSRDYSGLEPLYTGDVKTPLFTIIPITDQQAEGLYIVNFIHYYDAEGNELDSYELAEEYGYDGSTGGGRSSSSQSTFYVFCGIILLLAFVMVRYFIKP